MGAGDEGEEPTPGHTVLGGAGHLQAGEGLVGHQLLVPGPQEEEGQGEGGPGQGGEGGGGCGGARSLTEHPSASTEVVSEAHDVVGQVHGALAGLVDEETFVESSEALEGEEEKHQEDGGGRGGGRTRGSAEKVQGGGDQGVRGGGGVLV